MAIIAEGIKHEAQLERLRSLGCDGGQGFLFLGRAPASAQLTRDLLDSVSQ
ncbi:MAG TPA: hypothetical protein VHK70_09650 [Burkholderiaceae bacterium]|jgi:EAL domain-containing protein (putative c-di-GMP-specific phosphodiesterase class I)|nr:hypothetical protein [Burkholderiaceae bacterium]